MKKIIIALIVFQFILTSAYAQVEQINVQSDGAVNIKGSGSSNSLFSVIVYKKNPNFNTFNQTVVYNNELSTNQNGGYDFNFKIRDINLSTEYVVDIKITGEQSKQSKTFKYYAQNDINNYIGQIKSGNKTSIETILNNYADVFNVQILLDNSKVDKSKLSELIGIYANNNPDLSGFSQVENKIKELIVVQAFNEDKKEWLTDSNGYILENLGLGFNKIIAYSGLYKNANSKMNIQGRNEVYKELSKKGFTADGILLTEAEKKIIFSALRFPVMEGYGHLSYIIDNYKDKLISYGAKYDDYEKIDNKDMFYSQLNSVQPLNMESFVANFNNISGSIYKTQNNTNTTQYTPINTGNTQIKISNSNNTTNIETPNTDINKPKPQDVMFKDLDGYDWAKESIIKLTNNGIISNADYFYPSRNITREEFLKMVIIAFDLYDNNAQNSFEDVNANDWYYGYVSSALNSGIINGVTKSKFGTGIEITRQDMMVILERAVQKVGKEIKSVRPYIEFKDHNQISDYAIDAVKKLYNANIISGRLDSYFEPRSNANRAEATKIIASFIE